MPLQIKLESMDRNVYRERDQFFCRLSLQNVGQQDLTIPWEPDPEKVVTSVDAPMLEWLLVLSLDGREYDRLTFPIRTLYGSTFSPVTLKVLRPGEQAEIIARGKWQFVTDASAKRAEATLPRTVDVAARMDVLTGVKGHVYSDVISINRLPILLEQYR
jgi:hypothetical protein